MTRKKKNDKKIKDKSRDCSETFKPNINILRFMHAQALGADIFHLEQKAAFWAVLFLITRQLSDKNTARLALKKHPEEWIG